MAELLIEVQIVSKTNRLHADPDAYRLMAKGVSPYGDGKASARIAPAVGRFLSVEPPKAG
jgi:UDP-N-acetylglucosamine 2-epimerase (non-hydrolysing)